MELCRLYVDNERLLWYWVRRYAGFCVNRATVDMEDLFQSAYLGLVEASSTYDQQKGASWGTWAAYYVRNAIRDTLGLHSAKDTYTVVLPDGTIKRRRYYVDSLDAPAYASDDCDVSLMETVPDDSLPNVEECAIRDDNAARVRAALDAIDNSEARHVMVERYFRNKPMTVIAAEQGVPYRRTKSMHDEALRMLAKDKGMRSLMRERELEQRTRFHAHKGVGSFWSSGSSVVEDAVMWREQQRCNGMYDLSGA